MSNFQIVHTTAGWHARWRGNNNEIVWTTEVYESLEAAQQAIALLTTQHDFTDIEVVET